MCCSRQPERLTASRSVTTGCTLPRSQRYGCAGTFISRLLCRLTIACQIGQCNCVCFVVVCRLMAARLNACDHFFLTCIALAGSMLLDRADRYAFVGDLMVLTPGCQLSHEATVCMGSIHANMPAHLFKHDQVNACGALLHVREPAFEFQEPHTTTFKALRLEGLAAACDLTVCTHQGPASRCAQVQGKNRHVHFVSRIWSGDGLDRFHGYSS